MIFVFLLFPSVIGFNSPFLPARFQDLTKYYPIGASPVYEISIFAKPRKQTDQSSQTSEEGRLSRNLSADIVEATLMGLPVSDQMPEEIFQLMARYPQAKQQRPGVEFIPVPYRSPATPGKGEK
jgi:hypothetical protein